MAVPVTPPDLFQFAHPFAMNEKNKCWTFIPWHTVQGIRTNQSRCLFYSLCGIIRQQETNTRPILVFFKSNKQFWYCWARLPRGTFHNSMFQRSCQGCFLQKCSKASIIKQPNELDTSFFSHSCDLCFNRMDLSEAL